MPRWRLLKLAVDEVMSSQKSNLLLLFIYVIIIHLELSYLKVELIIFDKKIVKQ